MQSCEKTFEIGSEKSARRAKAFEPERALDAFMANATSSQAKENASNNQVVPVRECSLEPSVHGGVGDMFFAPYEGDLGAAAQSTSTMYATEAVPVLSGLAQTSQSQKLKASNCPATSITIGSWTKESRYEGDLLAKAYYAKRKLVWEVLEKGVKSKIEIPWADITAFMIEAPDKEPGRIRLRLAQPPHFFKEDEPQPRKHTIWLQTPDFTDGEASRCRQHTLCFPAGVLNKHYKKLLESDDRLRRMAEEAERHGFPDADDDSSMGADNSSMGSGVRPPAPSIQKISIITPTERGDEGDNGDMLVPDYALNEGGLRKVHRSAASADRIRVGRDDRDGLPWGEEIDTVEADAMVSMFLNEPLEVDPTSR